MAQFVSLPIDVIRNIIRIFVEERCVSLEEWVMTLPIIGVSSAWRTAGKDCVYASAFLENPWPGDSKSRYQSSNHGINEHGQFTAYSNIPLIEQFGLLKSVKQLTIAYNCTWSVPRLYPFNLMKINESTCPGVSCVNPHLLPNCSSADSMLVEPHAKIAANMHMAALFAHWIPNVCHLRLDYRFLKEFEQFGFALLYTYLPQLTYASYSGMSAVTTPIDSSMLKKLYLKLQLGGSAPFPNIVACNLRELSLCFYESKGQPERISESMSSFIGFDYLEVLQIDLSNEDNCLAKFRNDVANARLPRLHTLLIQSCSNNTTDIRWLLKNTLRVLRLCVMFNVALAICRHGLGGIEKLVLDFAVYEAEYGHEYDIMEVNELFSLTHGIHTVHMLVTSDNVIYCPRLSWFYLTHLTIDVCSWPIKLLACTLQMPNLAYLEVQNGKIQKDVDSEDAELRAIDAKHTEFAHSKLKIVSIKFKLFTADNSYKLRLVEFGRRFPELKAFDIFYP